MHVSERFLKYVSFDTQSDESSTTVPTTEKQKLLGAALVQELTEIGLHGARMDDYGYVYAWLPATAGCEGVPCLGLIAHMDTAPSAPGANVSPRVVHYTGGDIHLSDTVVMRASEFESLRRYVGQDLIVTDGTTLLGADDKAGVAEIVTAMEHLAAHPEIPHGRIAVAFTPDEEVGSGADHFDVEGFGAAAAYTVDDPPRLRQGQDAQRLPDGAGVRLHAPPRRDSRPHRGARGLLPPLPYGGRRDRGPPQLHHPGP